ncbi:helix-turn-helix domain-containing protein [Microbacterium terregens]|uniref:Helix-turn-helix domain-containing protein n=1 Tax=Microbacterium terregens TaxID=69363 RepID=A0ABV5SXG5_9MICO
MRVHAVDDEEAAAFSLAQWLRGVRDRRGMSQESVAHSADLAVSTYSRLERSTLSKKTANPTLATFVRSVWRWE